MGVLSTRIVGCASSHKLAQLKRKGTVKSAFTNDIEKNCKCIEDEMSPKY